MYLGEKSDEIHLNSLEMWRLKPEEARGDRQCEMDLLVRFGETHHFCTVCVCVCVCCAVFDSLDKYGRRYKLLHSNGSSGRKFTTE